MSSYPSAPPCLLGPDDPPPIRIENPGGRAKCLLLCDHAGRVMPKSLGLMGLTPEDFDQHYAYDPGAEMVTRRLSALLDAPALYATYSRLVVDPNREPDHPTAFAVTGEGKPIEANIRLTPEERAIRLRDIYEPYDRAAGGLVEGFLDRGIVPAVIAIHSFTPVFYGMKRPWEIGILWVQDARVPRPMMDFFRKKGFTVGDNEPYDGRITRGGVINRHADNRGLPNALVEIRNDLIRTEQGAGEWAALLHECLAGILQDETVHARYDGPLSPYDPDAERDYYDRAAEAAKAKAQT